MPLYMDRHDLLGLTPEQVAQAHVLDLGTSGNFGVQFLSYWFDASNGAAFCLANAPSPEAMQDAHRASHGLVSNEIIGVSENSVLRFLGSISDPKDAAHARSAFRTVLFTDLEGSTALLHQVGEPAWMELLNEHDVIIRRALVGSHGREVKHTGDGIMASFDEVAGALRGALEIQEGFRAREADGRTPALRVRVGLAAGEPVDHDDDIFGATVHLASRICNAAEPGHILVSELVHDLGVAEGFRFGAAAELELHGFPGRTRVFELAGRSRQARTSQRTEDQPARRARSTSSTAG